MNAAPKEKHLELIQAVISRMAGNSFLLKGWSVTLVAALLALVADGAETMLVLVAMLPGLLFWGLDGYFLAQERLFRKVYERAIDPSQTVADYDLNPGRCPFACWVRGALSPTLLAFHGTIVLTILLALGYLWLVVPDAVAPVKP